ncbi:hypothetical protein BKA82DRAFT_131829 [Pisolithus tinctorius]|uniref:Uncharacterized protein n=1 Tax=Pisolithus tinctorius Marx 270 TaxID=870435 RepID=A0A0C3KJ57_PISTI|nr:hypothetical protein BKA82DRAFT_131829 [Pisolithus tinctorius]KIO09617.1 hypothetical protein M404DRAFT_131829 [Pisolithus tinctorius Marx 270]
MRDEVENTMHSALITNEDKIFAQQLRRLHLDSVFRNDLSRYRDTAERAEDETPQRLEAHAEMESDAERLREQAKKDAERQEELRIIRKMREEKEKKRQEEERVRVEEARRRAREDREKLEEQQRKAREAREREAREREARGREAREREAREREAREREARQPRERAEAAHRAEENPRALQQLFALYEAKWAELKTNHALSSIDVRELPWPSLVLKHFTVQEITREDVLTFVFHPLRPCPMQKSAKDRVKVEVLRFHPDKFNVLVLPKVREDHRAVAQELAGAAVRALTTIMAESD